MAERDQVSALFKSRFSTPKEKRNWKYDWVVSDFVSEQNLQAIYTIITKMKKRDVVTVEFGKPVPQPESEAQLWGWLKKQAK